MPFWGLLQCTSQLWHGAISGLPHMVKASKQCFKGSILHHVYATDCTSITNIKSVVLCFSDHLFIHFEINIPQKELKNQWGVTGEGIKDALCSSLLT